MSYDWWFERLCNRLAQEERAVAVPVLNARQTGSNAFLDADRVVSVDPGRNPIISGVVYNENAMNTLGHAPPDNIHLDTVKWSKKEHYHECGFTYRTSMTKLWMSKSEEIMNFNNQAITTKTRNLYKAHAIHVLRNLHERMTFFSTKRFKHLKFKTFIDTCGQDCNTSAAINILFLFKNYYVDWNAKPAAFRRAPPPAVAAVALPVAVAVAVDVAVAVAVAVTVAVTVAFAIAVAVGQDLNMDRKTKRINNNMYCM